VDDTDRATESEEKYRDLALAAARNVPTLPTTGRCHYCDASVPPGAHFCDVDCREDYERERAAAKRSGVWA
jgi:predicted nucleic acid-binding Zn ribbon protein